MGEATAALNAMVILRDGAGWSAERIKEETGYEGPIPPRTMSVDEVVFWLAEQEEDKG